MKKILLIYSQRSSFVREDIDILSRHFYLEEYFFIPSKNVFVFLIQYIKQFIFLLRKLRKFDIVYVWFADYHAFIPILLGSFFPCKKIIILGGYDTMSLPQIKYGVFFKKNIRRALVKFSIRNADYLLGVDESMFEGINTYLDPIGIKVGVKNFITNLRGTCKVIPTGYNKDVWKRRKTPKDRMVLTIGASRDYRAYKRKGLDMFKALASRIPEVKFVIVGPSEEIIRRLEDGAPPNLKVIGFVSQTKLVDLASRAKVFCQFSMAEGLPNTLCECMLLECIPVGSSVNGIPKAIGEEQLIVRRYMDLDDAEVKVRYALSLSDEEGLRYRTKIINHFSKEKRENELVKLLSNVHT